MLSGAGLIGRYTRAFRAGAELENTESTFSPSETIKLQSTPLCGVFTHSLEGKGGIAILLVFMG